MHAPLDPAELGRALVRPESMWREIQVVEETGSTNADLAVAALAGSAEGIVLVAEAQTAGRGRLGRHWSAPARSGLTFSILLRPHVPLARQGWLPLLTGVAVVAALRRTADGPVLKWPNDVLLGERKLAGILVERVAEAEAAICGVGLNVWARREELPGPFATSLAASGIEVPSRDTLLAAILGEFEDVYRGWQSGEPGLRDTYKALCSTLGRDVRVELPGGVSFTGQARDIDPSGGLVVHTAGADRVVRAGDVIHVRPAVDAPNEH